MSKFIELTDVHGHKHLLSLDAIRRVDKRDGYDKAEVVCEQGLKTIYCDESYAAVVNRIRLAEGLTPNPM